MLRICLQRRFTYNFKALISPVSVYCTRRNKHDEVSSSFAPIYRLPLITKISLINRLKVYQSLLTAIAIPVSLALHQMSVVSTETLYLTTAIGISGCASFFLIGSIANKFVGTIYLSKEEDLVRIAYLDNWGKRKDVDIPVCDIIPISDTQTSVTDGLYVKLGRFSVQDKLKFNINHGQILDKRKFKKVFKPISNNF